MTPPPGTTIESATVDQGSCSISATEVTCVIPHLDAGGSAAIDVVAIEPAAGAAAGSTNEASLSPNQPDPTPANDSSAATAPMPPPGAPMADLAIQDQESSSQDLLGGNLTDTITVINHGPGTATGVDLTDALDAVAQVIAIQPGAFTCTSGMDIQCNLAELPPGASETLVTHFRPLRPGRLIDGVTASDDQFDPNYANDSAKAIATVRRRATAAKLRIVPLQPVATPGHVVGFVATIQALKRVPGVMPKVCVTLPRQLRVTTAPGAIADWGRLCWAADALINGAPKTYRFSARVIPVPGMNTSALTLHARLTGANFTASDAAARTRTIALTPPAPRVTG